MGILTQDNQEYEQQQPTYQLYPRQAPSPPPPDKDFFQFRIQSEDVLLEIEHKLRGEFFNREKGQWEQKYGAWCNDDFINIILSVVYDYTNKNTYLGNLTKEQILFKCRNLKIKISELVFSKYKDFDIDKSKRSLIISKIMNPIHSSLSRCEDGREADQISTAAQRHEVVNMSEKDDRPKGILSRFLPNRGGQ